MTLVAEAVTKRFGGLVAVNDLSFDLRENEVLGLIGPNGSGKTTMMNLISGALRADVGADPSRRREHFGYRRQQDRHQGRRAHVSDRADDAESDGA